MTMDVTADTLIARHSSELFRYLYRFVGRRGVAEDLLGDVFVKMLQQLQKTADPLFPWRAWLYRVAGNAAISHLRKAKFRSWIGLDAVAAINPEPSAQQQLEGDQSGRALQQAIAQLSPKLKSTLLLHAYQELSYKEIADAEQIAVGTVKSRINEAKRLIKRWLEQHHE